MLWKDLPYAGGLSAKEILDYEDSAKDRYDKDNEDTTLFTYGTKVPGKDTVGKVYLQQYDTDPETDYIVKSGISGIWTYQQWKSGIAKCWGTFSVTANIQTAIEGSGLFQDDNKIRSIKYPFDFKSVPAELATVQSPGGVVWLASKTKNTQKTSGIYTIISPDEQITSADYSVSLQVEGLWK